MLKLVGAVSAVVMAALAVQALAEPLQIGIGISVSETSGRVGPAAPVCGNTLDFSVACNSQYLGIM